MSEFREFKRKQITELRKCNEADIQQFEKINCIITNASKDNAVKVSISDVDLQNGSPKIGDMIARNPKNYLDQWLVAEEYFNDNFEPY